MNACELSQQCQLSSINYDFHKTRKRIEMINFETTSHPNFQLRYEDHNTNSNVTVATHAVLHTYAQGKDAEELKTEAIIVQRSSRYLEGNSPRFLVSV